MGIKLYFAPPSPPARMVVLLAKHLDIPLEVTTLDLLNKEQFQPEYLAINPQHAVPTLVDNGFIVTESRAILMYLQNKYGKDDYLYPKDPQKRALVDMRLFFDTDTLYSRFANSHYPVMLEKAKPDPGKLAQLDEALGYMESFLKDGYIAGDHLTIADFSMIAILSTIEAVGYDMSKHKTVIAYLAKCKRSMKGYDGLNHPGAHAFGRMYRASLAAVDE